MFTDLKIPRDYKIEKGAVDGFNKVTDKCVEKLFTKEGETVEEAKKRLTGKE